MSLVDFGFVRMSAGSVVPKNLDDAEPPSSNRFPHTTASATLGQKRARERESFGVEAADTMLTIAQLSMKETMMEMEQANIAVDTVAKKVGPATGLASDTAALLELLTWTPSRRMQRT